LLCQGLYPTLKILHVLAMYSPEG